MIYIWKLLGEVKYLRAKYDVFFFCDNCKSFLQPFHFFIRTKNPESLGRKGYSYFNHNFGPVF